MKIQFTEVGRDKKSWTAEIKELTESAIVRQVKKGKAILSSGIEAILNEDGKTGYIIVGGFRTVGQFSVEHANAEEASLFA